MTLKRAASLALIVAMCACQDDFEKPTLIARPRLLGAQVTVEGERLRATPRPGETARAELVVVGPPRSYRPERMSTLLVRCTYPSRFTGIPICQEFLDLLELSPDELRDQVGAITADPEDLRIECEDPLQVEFSGVQLNCITGEPRLEVTVPATFRGGDVLLRGVVCPSGRATFDPNLPELFTCAGSGRDDGIAVHMRMRVAYDDESLNDNPDPALLGVTLNGLPFPQVTDAVAEDDCSAAARAAGMRVIDPFDHQVDISVPRSEREITKEGARETFELSLFATSGEVGRRFTLYSDDDGDAGARGTLLKSVPWTGDGTVDYGESKRVDFWITARDQRGGLTVFRRSACVELADPF